MECFLVLTISRRSQVNAWWTALRTKTHFTHIYDPVILRNKSNINSTWGSSQKNIGWLKAYPSTHQKVRFSDQDFINQHASAESNKYINYNRDWALLSYWVSLFIRFIFGSRSIHEVQNPSCNMVEQFFECKGMWLIT